MLRISNFEIYEFLVELHKVQEKARAKYGRDIIYKWRKRRLNRHPRSTNGMEF